MADQRGNAKSFLGLMVPLGGGATAMLWFVKPDPSFAMMALLLSALSIFAMEISFVFYNARLPSVSQPEGYGRASGLLPGVGYAGAITALLMVLVLFVMPDTAFGIGKEQAAHIRITMCFAALWLVIFAAPLFLFVRSPSPQPRKDPLITQLRDSIAIAMRISTCHDF